MANFNVPAPVNLVSNELIVAGNVSYSHTVLLNNVSGTSSTSFSNNQLMSPSSINYSDGYTFTIGSPTELFPLDIRPSNGQVYPR